MRVLGVDYGKRRIGLAISDETALLARPWETVPAGSTPVQSAAAIAERVAREAAPLAAAGLEVIALGELTGLPVHLQDERLSSHEADQRLAERERDWRRRKAQLDAAAAAVILQDYLDSHGPRARSGLE